MKKSKRPNPEFENSKKLISLYLKGNINWPKEIKIAKRLLSQYPIEFWGQYVPQIEVYSLSAFLTSTAQLAIDREFNMYCLTKPKEEVKLESSPVIDLREIKINKKTNKTLLEFVDNVS